MTKTKEELIELKNEYDSLKNKLNELTDDELVEVTGGVTVWDIAVKLKEKFNMGVLGSQQNNKSLTGVNAHGKNEKPTLPLCDEVSAGFIDDQEN